MSDTPKSIRMPLRDLLRHGPLPRPDDADQMEAAIEAGGIPLDAEITLFRDPIPLHLLLSGLKETDSPSHPDTPREGL